MTSFKPYIEDDQTLCGRCLEILPIAETVEAACPEHPEDLVGQPLGQYHCPTCGMMLIAGIPHFRVCKKCNREIINLIGNHLTMDN